MAFSSAPGQSQRTPDFSQDLPSPHLLNRHHLEDQRLPLSSSIQNHGSLNVDRMEKSQVLIPIALPALRDRTVKGASTKAIELSFVSGKPCALASWGFTPQLEDVPSPPQDQQTTPIRGAFVGCEDGSVYLFHPKLGVKTDLISPFRFNFEPMDTPLHTRPTTPSVTSYLGRNSSAFSSQSSLKSTTNPFHLSRSRVVSGVTAEAVEAPKNYVDFEDEQERLKGLLKHKGPVKERHLMDAVLPSFEKNISLEKHPAPLSLITTIGIQRKPTKKKSESRAHSTPHSRTPSHPNNTISAQTSPAIASPQLRISGNIYSLYLHSHTFPPRFGPGKAISQFLVEESQRYVICLQENGDISIFSTIDGSCHVSAWPDSSTLLPPSGMADHRTLHCAWAWEGAYLVKTQNTTFIISLAASDSVSFRRDSLESDLQDHTRVSVYIFTPESSDEPKLEKVGEWCVDGCAGGVSCHKHDDDSFTLTYVDSLQRMMSHTVRLVATPVSRQPPSRPPSRGGVISLPNPFKILRATHFGAPDVVGITELAGRVEVDTQVELGVVPIEGIIVANRTILTNDERRAIFWTESGLTVIQAQPGSLREIWSTTIPPTNAEWIGDSSFMLAYPGSCELHVLTTVDADGVPPSGDTPMTGISCNLTRSTIVPDTGTTAFTAAGDLLSTNSPGPLVRSVDLTILPRSSEIETSPHYHTLCEISSRIAPAEVYASASLALDIDSIVIGYSDGYLHSVPLSRLCSSSPAETTSDIPLRGPITTLFPVENERTKERLIVGGADDGSVAFWSAETLKICARWTLFNTPLTRVIRTRGDTVGRLKGSLLCVARDGAIAVLDIDGFQFLYLIPGSMSPLVRVCIGGDNLLLIYGDRHARLWDVRTREFWRAMSVDKADELIGQGGWAEWCLDRPPNKTLELSGLDTPLHTVDSATAFNLNLATFLVRSRPAMGQPATHLPDSEKQKIRSVLSILLTWGLNEGIDEICKGRLHITTPADVGVGYSRSGSTSLYTGYDPASGWKVSPEQSASRALAILACLQVLDRDPSLSRDVEVVSAFYLASLGDLIGEGYHSPSLSSLAIAWACHPDEFREPAKSLFDAGLARFTDQEIVELAELWQHKLPCLQPDTEKPSLTSVVATFICGSIAVEKYSLFSPSCLADVSKSISMYLHDDRPICKILAIDLCSRSFNTWQSYVDVMELLRSLFTLATHTKKDGITTLNVGTAARSAVLQIVSNNTPLVMTALSMDIMHVTDVQQRKSLMQMLTVLIRKRPLVIQPHLPRLIEAVVKSLDPNSSGNREATIDDATEILVHVVQIFPTVDFHMNTQRLAVGTSEGAIIMFDLKTATRLYVLENHRQRLAACSFSPDGRRLITVSLDENVVLVWKVGSSLSSFFNPGAPPRQGHGDGEPYKTWEFNVGDAAKLTPAETLIELKIEWVGDRSVKLMVRDVTMTFSA